MIGVPGESGFLSRHGVHAHSGHGDAVRQRSFQTLDVCRAESTARADDLDTHADPCAGLPLQILRGFFIADTGVLLGVEIVLPYPRPDTP